MTAELAGDGRLRAVLATTRGIDLPPGAAFAAVLVPLVEDGVLLTRRAASLRQHAGQVAFPGGRIDAGDASAEAAALREAHEEIGLDPARAAVLGRLPAMLTVTGYHVTPVVARITGAAGWRPACDEVAAIFVLPSATLRDPAAPARRSFVWQGRRRESWVWPHQQEHIWGATAAILLDLAAALTASG